MNKMSQFFLFELTCQVLYKWYSKCYSTHYLNQEVTLSTILLINKKTQIMEWANNPIVGLCIFSAPYSAKGDS